MGRTPCCDKANVKKGPWSSEEDAKLKAYMEENATGGNWITLPQKIGLKRCGKSCRLRWLNYLRPNIKHGGFSEEEDNIICNLYISIGSRWSIIASQLPGRTDNDIKNYWNTKLKKKLLGRRKQSHRASMQDPRDLKSDGEEGCSQALSSPSQDRLQLPMQPHCFENYPFPFPSNSRVWPNLLPIQETTTNHSLQCSHNTNQGWIKAPLVPQQVSPSPPLPIPPVMLTQNVNLYDIDRLQVLEMDDLENNFNGIWFNKAVDNCGEHVCVEAVQPKLKDLVTNHMAVDDISAQQQDHTAEFDYSNGMMNEWNSDSINVWGCNEFGSKSSSSSWDSISPGLSESDEAMMFQDYMLSYNML